MGMGNTYPICPLDSCKEVDKVEQLLCRLMGWQMQGLVILITVTCQIPSAWPAPPVSYSNLAIAVFLPDLFLKPAWLIIRQATCVRDTIEGRQKGCASDNGRLPADVLTSAISKAQLIMYKLSILLQLLRKHISHHVLYFHFPWFLETALDSIFYLVKVMTFQLKDEVWNILVQMTKAWHSCCYNLLCLVLCRPNVECLDSQQGCE